MAIFLTGSTGYLGSYIAADLLRGSSDRLALLIRARSLSEAQEKLWRAMQLHMSFEEFSDRLGTRIDLYLGDLTMPELGLDPGSERKLTETIDSVIHCAASLNRRSVKTCLNVNLRGTLAVVKLARAAHEKNGLRRFSDISTVAVAGKRRDEIVAEPEMIDWNRSDYDPYAMTKKFAEHMIEELLPDVKVTVFRPSTILGDSRFPQTTQFEMLRAFIFFAKLPLLPLRAEAKIDIVPADYVSRAVVHIHQNETPKHLIYNLSSGTASLSYREIVHSLRQGGLRVPHIFLPIVERPFSSLVSAVSATPRSWGLSHFGSLLKVFLPYITYNTLFSNARVREELGESPRRLDEYIFPLVQYALTHRYQYPYKPWPQQTKVSMVA